MSNKSKKITVYLPSHNYGKYLEEAIESVLRQTVDSWELFLINENSSDNTHDIMNLYVGDDRIKIHDTPNLGLPGVANYVLEKAEGEYIIRLDADDVFDENILLVLSNYLDTHPDIALVFPDYFLMDKAGYIYAQERRQPIYYSNHMLDIPPNGAATMVRADLLKKIGGYRVDLGAQDGFELWNKILKEHKCANVNIPLFYYRKHGNNLTGKTNVILNAKRRIKKDFSSLRLDEHRPITAIIPCRKNYDFLPDLWDQKIGRESLLDIVLKKCTNSLLFDQIIVTSDNVKVKDIILKNNDSRIKFHERSNTSTIRSRPITYTLESVIKEVDPDFNGLTLLSVLQAPFIATQTMEEAIYSLILNDADGSILVKEVDAPLYERTPHGIMQINYKGFLVTDFDTLYMDTRTCVVLKNKNLKKGSLTGSNIVSIVSQEEEVFYVKNETDLEFARFLTVKS